MVGKHTYHFLVWMCLMLVAQNMEFQTLYDKELKSSYGFEILKYYHDEKFGNEDVKKFNG